MNPPLIAHGHPRDPFPAVRMRLETLDPRYRARMAWNQRRPEQGMGAFARLQPPVATSHIRVMPILHTRVECGGWCELTSVGVDSASVTPMTTNARLICWPSRSHVPV